MTPDEIKQKADALITELGLSPSVTGVADEKIGMGTYVHILAEYQQMLNDALVLHRELAKEAMKQNDRITQLETKLVGMGLPKSGNLA